MKVTKLYNPGQSFSKFKLLDTKQLDEYEETPNNQAIRIQKLSKSPPKEKQMNYMKIKNEDINQEPV